MQFIYLDMHRRAHVKTFSAGHPSTLIDIDPSWLSLGYVSLPKRKHKLECFEAIQSQAPQDSYFTFRHWYVKPQHMTECMWYAVPKNLLENINVALDARSTAVKSFLFELPRFWPGLLGEKPTACLVSLGELQYLVGYVNDCCVCYKKIEASQALKITHHWHYLRQEYPQWQFDQHILLSDSKQHAQGFDQFIHIAPDSNHIITRAKLYGLH